MIDWVFSDFDFLFQLSYLGKMIVGGMLLGSLCCLVYMGIKALYNIFNNL